jgi:hypothetical protein
MKSKVLTSQAHFPLPVDYIPTLPLPYPRLILQLAKKPAEPFLRSFMAAIEPLRGNKVDVGRGSPVFTIDRPTFSAIQTSFRPYANASSPQIEGYAQYPAALASLQIYQFLDLFLRVQTYDYKGPTNPNEETGNLDLADQSLGELRTQAIFFRPGVNDKNIKGVLSGKGKRKVDMEEQEDLTAKTQYILNGHQTVLVAKPSPHPSSNNYGGTGAVPNKPGLFFPYFRGMISSDTKGLRDLISSLMFRNLGDPKDGNPKEAYKHLRSIVGTVASTEEGLILHHALFGCKMALDAQAILYLVIVDGTYRGFCLLGNHFSVFHNGSWVSPLSEQALRDELRTIRDRTETYSLLAAKMGQLQDEHGHGLMIDENRLPDLGYLASCLAKLRIKDDQKELEQDVSNLLGSVLTVTEYRTFKPSLIADSVESLVKPDKDISSIPFYIPITNWSGIDSREYQVFASYGPRSFSFRTPRGTEIRIPIKSTDPDQLRGDKKTKEEGVYNKILAYEKPVREAIRDWEDVRRKGSIKMDMAERAAGQRAHLFMNEQKDIIWNMLKRLAASGELVEENGEPSRKRARIDMGDGDFTNEFVL